MSETKGRNKVNIIGHINPDTDSVCAAISYAWLKNQLAGTKYIYEARRAGHLNRETRFVLRHFGVTEPRLCTDISPQIKDIDIRCKSAVNSDMSLYSAWQEMITENIDTLCIADADGALQGIINVKDIAGANMSMMDTNVLSAAKTPCGNLISTLGAQLLCGDANAVITKGKILIGTSPEVIEEHVEPGDIVLVTNRYETHLCALECGAAYMIVCAGAAVPRTILSRAQEKGCTVMTTACDTFAAARLIGMAAPVRHFMVTDGLMTFNINSSVEDASRVMASVRHHYFPILDKGGRYIGVISRRNLLNLHRKQVIMVDHNEAAQAVEGLEEAEVLEIIDHHRIGSLETGGPVYFRNVPVGSTCTIIYTMYKEYGITPPREMAGLMLSAILSDTLQFRSPTSTSMDENAAKELAMIADIDIPSYAEAMFTAGGDLTDRTAYDVFTADFKVFSRGDVRFGVGQSTFMTAGNTAAAEELVGPYLPEAAVKQGVPMVFYMVTNMKTGGSSLLFWGNGSAEIVEKAFNVKTEHDRAELPGVVSRKKQLIPPLMAAMQEK